ncbi:Uncharacterised protein [Bordetella pertussis]|nr:Uncharacterised protein [Bordetella pertussis]
MFRAVYGPHWRLLIIGANQTARAMPPCSSPMMRRPSCVITAWRERLSLGLTRRSTSPRSCSRLMTSAVVVRSSPSSMPIAVWSSQGLSDRAVSTPYCTGVTFCVLHSS